MKQEFTKRTLFYRVFHDEKLAPFADAIFPSHALRTVLSLYPLGTSRRLLSLDTDAFLHGLNELRRRSEEGNLYVALGPQSGLFPFVIGKNAPFVLLIPGGAYEDVCMINEGFLTAIELNRMGYNAFVCKYRTGEFAKFPAPQEDVAKTLRWICQNAPRLKVDCRDYAVCGFSAGGHLAARRGTKQARIFPLWHGKAQSGHSWIPGHYDGEICAST